LFIHLFVGLFVLLILRICFFLIQSKNIGFVSLFIWTNGNRFLRTLVYITAVSDSQATVSQEDATQASASPLVRRVLDLSQSSVATSKSGATDKTSEGGGGGRDSGPKSPMSTQASALVKNVLFPAFRSILHPPPEFAEPANAVFVQVAMLDNLYKIFERC
jgi:hypothetical protein